MSCRLTFGLEASPGKDRGQVSETVIGLFGVI